MAGPRTPILAALAVGLVTSVGLPAVQADPAPPVASAEVQQVVVQVAGADDPAAVVAEAGATPLDATQLTAPGFVAVDASPEGVARLQADARVGSVLTRGTTVGLAMEESVPLLGAPARWASGYRGEGKVVAVIDTGVDPDFGGTYVGGACFAATEVSFGTYDGHCGTTGAELRAFDQLCFDLGVCGGDDPFDAAAGRPCAVTPGAPARECLHGTAVSAVAARHEPTPGVAPDAGIYGIRVFDPSGTSADLVDVYAALEHVLALSRAGLDVSSVNLSVATSALFSTACDNSPALNGAIQAFRFIVGELANRRVPVVVASGNDGRRGELAFPACLSATVSVGATDLDDELAPFTNAGPGLDLLAPGAEEASGTPVPLDVPSAPGTPRSWAGTSFAAPHVAGALALVDEEYPSASVDQRVWLLRRGGAPVRDGTTTRWRMGLRDASQLLYAGILFPGDAPLGATSRAAMGDFDGDGRSDVVAHVPGPAPDRVAYGRTDWRFDPVEHRVAGTYLPIVGAFRGAAGGPDDIVWYAAGAAGDSVWEGVAGRRFQPSALVIDGTFRPEVGDFDGDGWDDIFWYAPGPERDAIWYGGQGGFASVPVSVRGAYRVAVGDFDGDGVDDLVFHGPGIATDTLWRGTPTRGTFAPSSLDIGGSHLPLVLDANGDGVDDVLLYAPGTTADPLWLGGASGFTSVPLSVRGTYTPVTGDLDGDGFDDIVWYAAGPAGDSVWFGTSTGRFVGASIGVNGTYRPLVGDVDGSGADDIVWSTGASATTPVWWSHRG